MRAEGIFRTTTVLVLPVLLAACGSSDPGTAAGSGGDATFAATAEPEAVSCTGLPAHVALLPDARVSLCTKGETGPGRTSGTVIFATASPATAVLAFYREQAAKAGLRPGVSTPVSFSAIDGTRRTLMAMVADAEGGKRQVTLNWGVEP